MEDSRPGYNSLLVEGIAKILVVDDEELVRSSLARFLANKGHQIEEAENGFEAIKKLEKHSFDLVLTDLKMPVADGREVLRVMGERFASIPRIVLTAVGSDEDILLALKTGAYDFLTKPILDYNLLMHSVNRALERKRFNDERHRTLVQMEQINNIISMLNRGKETEEIFQMLYVSLRAIIPFNRIDVIELVRDRKKIKITLSQSDRQMIYVPGDEFDLDSETYHNLSKKSAIKIYTAIEDLVGHPDFPAKFRQIINEGWESALLTPLIINGYVRGFLSLLSDQKDAYDSEHSDFLNLIAGHVAFSLQRGDLLSELGMHTRHLEHLVKVRTHEVLKTQKTTIFALSKLAEIRDNETGEHLERMRNYCVLMGQLLKYTTDYDEITNDFLKTIYDSSILHDIGKVGIPDAILLKPAPLTPEEFEIMKTHSQIGFGALEEASKGLGDDSFLTMAKEIALYHHERWDGKGYPSGKKEQEIPIAARIVCLGDIYDALTSKRPYKDAFTHEQATRIMEDEFYRFDPRILKVFLDNHGDFDRIRRQFA